jgi:hypothetical protein
LPGLADASPMFKTVATVEYDELMRTKQMFDQQVHYISTLENQVSVLPNDLPRSLYLLGATWPPELTTFLKK